MDNEILTLLLNDITEAIHHKYDLEYNLVNINKSEKNTLSCNDIHLYIPYLQNKFYICFIYIQNNSLIIITH